MKRFALTLFITLFCSILVVAQNSDWKIYTQTDEEFSVEAPESFRLIRYYKHDKDVPKLYGSLSNGAYLFVVSDPKNKSDLIKQTSDLAKENQAKISDVTIDSFTGKMFTFSDSEGFHQKIVAVEAKKRFYVFHALSETENSADVEKFINSIRLDKTLPQEEKTEAPVTKNTEETTTKSTEEKAIIPTVSGADKRYRDDAVGDGSLTAAQSGGIGTGNPNAVKSPNQTSPLKILSKPKPPYTDLARFYDIQGQVQLKVVFRADGKIGSIMPFSRLPFGLTTSAIKAAEGLRFEPPYRDGKPYSVVKMVVYSFTIY